MTPDEVIGLMRKGPFEPFEVHLNNGSTFHVTHPDQAMVYPPGELLFMVVGNKMERAPIINTAHISREPVSS